MKLTRSLFPSLESIEKRLFGISPELIAAVERGETSKGIASAVMQSEEWARRGDAAEEHSGLDSQKQDIQLSEQVLDVIRRRSEAIRASALLRDAVPSPGLIVELSEIKTPRPHQLDWVMQVPLFVLLDAPDEAPQVWHGWLVSGEPDYATWWDFVLQEVDAPFEPFAGVVQLWNPVSIYLPMIGRAVSRLSLARLQAVRALASDYVEGSVPSGAPIWPGRVAVRETTDGMTVATGSPLGDERDPRHRYQHLLHYAAEAVREPARLQVGGTAEAPSAARLLESWLESARRLGEVLELQPRVALAMGERSPDYADLVWLNVAKISVVDLSDDGAGRIVVSALDADEVTVELRVSGVLHHRQKLVRGETSGVFEWDAGAPRSITLSAGEGRTLTLQCG